MTDKKPIPPAPSFALSPMRARVAASFCRPAKNLSALKKAGLDIAELRLDLIERVNAKKARQLAALFAAEEIPLLAALRTQEEGGGWRGDPAAAGDLLRAVLPYCAAVDIELSAVADMSEVIAQARKCGAAVIISRHYCDKMPPPETLDAVATAAFAVPAYACKIACRVETRKDFEVLRDFLQKWRACPVIVIGLGENRWAKKTRTDFPREGSRLTFAVADMPSAPGQLPLADAVKLLR